MSLPNAATLKAVGFGLLAAVSICSGALFVYNRYTRSSSHDSAEESTAGTEQATNTTAQSNLNGENTSDVLCQNGDGNTVQDNSVLGDVYMALIGLMLMVLVTVVAIIISIIDDGATNVSDFRLYSPLMWVGTGIIAASCPAHLSDVLAKYSKDAGAKRSGENESRPSNEYTAAPAPNVASSSVASIPSNSTPMYQEQVHNCDVPVIPAQQAENTAESIRPAEATTVPQDPQIAGVISKAESLYTEGKHREIYEYLKEKNQTYPSIANILWRLARATKDTMEGKSKEDQKALAFEALEYAKLAIAADDNCAAAHKWYAIMTSTTGDFKDTSQKIAGAYVIKEHITRSIALDSKDPTAHNILGQWSLAFANMSWIEKKAAAALFGQPPTATYDDAIKSFLNAENINPGFWKKNSFLLAETYYKIKNYPEAKRWATKTAQIANVTTEDFEVQKDLDVLMKKL